MVHIQMTRGEIILVRLKNFMSYNDIELRPGHHLNLIIGPNGTGKSTFVCAVLLGLGGKLKSLGRGDQLCSYVKNGCTESVIDIELYDSDDGNVLITRTIHANNQSEFAINGRTVPASKINDIRAKYNIQIDNLCTFLPQEKVQDFSKLNHQQLLDQTQKTVGSNEMISAYEQLKSLQTSIKDKEKMVVSLENQLASEKEKNDRMKDRVKNLIEKQALCDKLQLMSRKKSWLTYHNELVKLKEITRDYKRANEKYAERKKNFNQATEELTQMEERIRLVQEEFSKAKRDFAAKRSMCADRANRFRERVENLEDLENVVRAKLAEEEGKEVELKRYQEMVDKLRNDLINFETKNGTDEEVKVKETDIGDQIKEKRKEETKLMYERGNVEDELERLQKEMSSVTSERRLLEKKRDFRLEYIKRYEPDVYKSVEWLESHGHLFQGKIYKPMLLELDVKNEKMAKYIEAFIGYRDLISFTCTNPDDLNVLIQKLRIEQRLKVNAICSDEDDMSQYNPSVPLNQMRNLGFFAYMKDLITGPSHIIRYLCKVYKIHSIPIGDETTKSKCDKVPTSIPIFFSENHMFTVKISVYSGDKSINVKQLKEPKLFSVSFNNERMLQLAERMVELEEARTKCENKIELANQSLKKIESSIESITQAKSQLARLREEKKQIRLKLKRAEDNAASVRSTMKEKEEILREINAQRQTLKKAADRCLESMKEAAELCARTEEDKRAWETQRKAEMMGVDEVARRKATCAEELSKMQDTLNKVKAVKLECEATCSRLKEEARKLTGGLAPGERGFDKFEKEFQKLKNTVEELEAEMQEIQVKADFLPGGNSEILKEYENREKEIAGLEVSLDRAKSDVTKKRDEVARARNEWLDPLNALVSRINDNFGNFFQTMGCVGEVSLTHGENEDDFDQYGITIKVKFRDEIPLQTLGRHFQSGGERAVATAVYLLSLQEMIRVPFRFVDEINQGMDSTNERRIMSLMINITGGQNSTQYFFITPKILSDVECSESMVIHCIYSGPKALPCKSWDLDKFLSTPGKSKREDRTK